MALIEVNSLSKAFGEIKAVQDLSFSIADAAIYGLLGPNGAGKTTSISMISGLLKPDSGKVVIDGHDFWSNPGRAQRIMGVVPQDIALYDDLSGRENLVFWGRLAGLEGSAANRRADEVLEALALADRAKDAVKRYSGGMKRRINLGCALMHRPRLLLLDEPTVGIDPQARLKILDFVRGLVTEGTTVLYTTHYLEEAELLCDRIGIIDHGRLLAEGTLAELQQRLGGDQVFILEGRFAEAEPDTWGGFTQRFRILQRSDRQLMVAALGEGNATDHLKELLELPVEAENVTLKKPSLNDVFLQLTGRELRE